MLIVQNKATFHANVEVVFAGDKTVHRFAAEFNRLSQSDLEEINTDSETDRSIARRVLAGWSGVQDATGAVMEFNDENRETLLDLHPVAACVVKAFYAGISGAKRKN